MSLTTDIAAAPIALSPKVAKQTNGKFTIYHVPIFAKHTRGSFKCDDAWMYAAEKRQAKNAQVGTLPRGILQHNPEGNDAPQNKPEFFLNGYKYDQPAGLMYADFVEVPDTLLGEIMANKWPGISPEVYENKQPEIPVVSLHPNAPTFLRDKMPDLRFAQGGVRLNYTEYQDENGVHPAMAALSPEVNADLAKLEQLLNILLTKPEWKARFGGEPDGDEIEPKKGAKPVADKTAKTPEELEKEKAQKMSEQDTATKYADLSTKLEALTNAHNTTRADLVKAQAENARLSDELETAKWTKYFDTAKVPAKRLDVAEQVKYVMTLPSDKRLSYAENIVKAITPPPTKPINTADHLTPTAKPEPGTKAEGDAIKRYIDKNPTKYTGADAVFKAMKDYRNDPTAV